MSEADYFRVPVGTGALHVERYGFGGSPFLLLHGFATSAFLWRHVGPALALQRATAFAVDMLGYGESDRPFAADFGITAQASYLDLALTALRVAKATIVGVDVGALAALRLAFDRPERVERLVLISPAPLRELPAPEVRELQRASARYALTLNRSLLGAMPMFRDFLVAQVSDPERMPPTLVGRYLAPFLGREGLNHLQTLARAIEDDELDDVVLEEVHHPTSVVRGSRDRQCDLRDAESYVRALPAGRYVEVPSVGRLIPEEAPSALVGILVGEETAAAEAERGVKSAAG
ncbi:MAG: alpha/beta hydrolase [Gemmatimonadaceae bacterium]